MLSFFYILFKYTHVYSLCLSFSQVIAPPYTPQALVAFLQLFWIPRRAMKSCIQIMQLQMVSVVLDVLSTGTTGWLAVNDVHVQSLMYMYMYVMCTWILLSLTRVRVTCHCFLVISFMVTVWKAPMMFRIYEDILLHVSIIISLMTFKFQDTCIYNSTVHINNNMY